MLGWQGAGSCISKLEIYNKMRSISNAAFNWDGWGSHKSNCLLYVPFTKIWFWVLMNKSVHAIMCMMAVVGLLWIQGPESDPTNGWRGAWREWGVAQLIRAIYTQLVMVASNIIPCTHNTKLNTVCYCWVRAVSWSVSVTSGLINRDCTISW